MKLAVLREAGRRCAACGQPLPPGVARLIQCNENHRFEAGNVICLCAGCHRRSEEEGGWDEERLKRYKLKPWVSRQLGRKLHGDRWQKLTLILDLPADEYDGEMEERLLHGLLQFLETQEENLIAGSITENSGSMRLEIRLPGGMATKLTGGFEAEDPRLAEAVADLPLDRIEAVDGPITVDDLSDLMGELRMMAGNLLRGESDADSIRATALAISGLRRYKLSDEDWSDVSWENRGHFFKSLYMMMRRALIDHARKRHAKGRAKLVGLDEGGLDQVNLATAAHDAPEFVIMLEEALGILAEEDEELALIVQHFYFGRYSVKEIADIEGVSEKTIKRRLAEARLRLAKIIQDLTSPDPDD